MCSILKNFINFILLYFLNVFLKIYKKSDVMLVCWLNILLVVIKSYYKLKIFNLGYVYYVLIN